MSIASINFSATLPTYNAVGSNGTTFASNTLSATGNLLVNTRDPSTGQPSAVSSTLIANGLSYSELSFSLSGDTLSVIYGLPATDTAQQNLQAADTATALSGGYPGNVVNFSASSSDTAGNQSTTNYNVATSGVLGNVPPDKGFATASTTSGDGTNLTIASITTGPGNTLDVNYTVEASPQATTSPESLTTAVSQNNTNGTTASISGTSTIAGILAGLKSPSISSPANAGSLSPGELLAHVLSPLQSQSISIYNLVAGFGTSSPISSISFSA